MTRIIQTLCISGLCLFAGVSTASAAVHPGTTEVTAKKDHKKAGEKKGSHKLNFILKNADKAGLTADQVTKLKGLQSQSLGKKALKHQVKSILTADQITTLKGLHKHHHHKKTK